MSVDLQNDTRSQERDHPERASPRSVALVAAAAAAATLLLSIPVRAETTLVEFGSSMRYSANASDPGLGLAWTAEGFVDAGWPAGSYGVGYENNPGGAQNLLSTTVPSGTLSVYTRAPFTIADVSAVQNLFLAADYDDGHVAWINGVEVYRSTEMPSGGPAWNTPSGLHESSNALTPQYGPLQDITAPALSALHDGVNVLAVGVWNAGSASSDLVLVPKLVVETTSSGPSLVRGPYLQLRTPTSIVIRWRTSIPADGVVSYGSAPGSLTSSVSHGPLLADHSLTLTGLQPDTRYFYSVGSSSGALAGGDAQHHFRTAPLSSSTKARRIWVLGDSGRANADAWVVRDAYAFYAGALPTDFWLMLGDNAYDIGTDAQFQAAVFETYPVTLRSSVLWPSYGNHDSYSADAATQTGPYFDIFSLPAAGQAGGVPSQTEAYFSFDDGNAHFIVLDSSESSRAPGSPMLTWLQQDLAATTKDWIIAYWHHPPYSKGSHNSDTEIELLEMRQNALPILEAGGADLVLCGHSHSYERSYLIDGHYGTSGTFTEIHTVNGGDGQPGSGGAYTKPQIGPHAHQGTVYVVAGSSARTSGGTLDHPAMLTSLNVLGSLALDILGNRLDVAFIDDAAAVRDSFTIIKGPEIAPGADFFASPTSGIAPLAVSFTDRSTNTPTAWSWDFEDDGTADSSAQNPSRVYSVPGLYAVSLTAANGAGDGSATKPAFVCVVSGAPPAAVANLRVDSDHQTISWDALVAPAATYDVVKGDLSILAAENGNFTTSLQGCLLQNGGTPSVTDAALPGPGGGFYYIARARDCAGGAGTYDGGGGRAGRVEGRRDRRVFLLVPVRRLRTNGGGAGFTRIRTNPTILGSWRRWMRHSNGTMTGSGLQVP